jgi:hypothetical protein
LRVQRPLSFRQLRTIHTHAAHHHHGAVPVENRELAHQVASLRRIHRERLYRLQNFFHLNDLAIIRVIGGGNLSRPNFGVRLPHRVRQLRKRLVYIHVAAFQILDPGKASQIIYECFEKLLAAEKILYRPGAQCVRGAGGLFFSRAGDGRLSFSIIRRCIGPRSLAG